MKAVIVDRRGEYAVVLKEDGTFDRIRRAGEIGTEILLPEEALLYDAGKTGEAVTGSAEKAAVPQKSGVTVTGPAEKAAVPQKRGRVRTINRTLAALSTAAAITLFGIGSRYYYTNVQAAAIITLGSDTSVTFEVNRKDEVIRVTAGDEQAQAVIDELKSENMTSGKIIDVLSRVQQLMEDPSDPACEPVFSVVSEGDPEREERLQKELASHFEEKAASNTSENEQTDAEKVPEAAPEGIEQRNTPRDESFSVSGGPEEDTGNLSESEKQQDRAGTGQGTDLYRDGNPDQAGASRGTDLYKDGNPAQDARENDASKDAGKQMGSLRDSSDEEWQGDVTREDGGLTPDQEEGRDRILRGEQNLSEDRDGSFPGEAAGEGAPHDGGGETGGPAGGSGDPGGGQSGPAGNPGGPGGGQGGPAGDF